PPLELLLLTNAHDNTTWGSGGVASWTCDAMLLPAGAASPHNPLSSLIRHALSIATPVITAANETALSVKIGDLDAATTQLGADLQVQAECVWNPTGERVRLPPLLVTTPSLSLTLVDPDNPSAALSSVPVT